MLARTWPALEACSKPSREAYGGGRRGQGGQEGSRCRPPTRTIGERPPTPCATRTTAGRGAMPR
eukprot:5272679-Alexandrium_andersonii.AAC.1